jgi:hypothetical protein
MIDTNKFQKDGMDGQLFSPTLFPFPLSSSFIFLYSFPFRFVPVVSPIFFSLSISTYSILTAHTTVRTFAFFFILQDSASVDRYITIY